MTDKEKLKICIQTLHAVYSATWCRDFELKLKRKFLEDIRGSQEEFIIKLNSIVVPAMSEIGEYHTVD